MNDIEPATPEFLLALQFPDGYSDWLRRKQDAALAAAGLRRAERREAMNSDIGPPADLAATIRAAHKKQRSPDVRERAVRAFFKASARPLAEDRPAPRAAAGADCSVPGPADLGKAVKAERSR